VGCEPTVQLEKVVQYHKALADPTRIRLLILLAEGESNGQDLAEKLGVTPATVTHHAAKLREVGLIRERREKNTIYFALHHAFIRDYAGATEELIYRKQKGGTDMLAEEQERVRQAVLKNFFTAGGALKHLPAQLKKKLIVLEHLASQLEVGRKYDEKEINAFVKRFHDDFATIRREFIMHQFLYREKEIYELNPREMWARWEKLS